MAQTTVFSSTLQKLRKEKGVTQEQLANYLGVSPQAVSKWENGSYPEGDLLPRISEFFGVTISYLYGQESKQVSIEQAVMDRLREIMVKYEEDERSGSNHPEYFDQMLDIVWAFQTSFWRNNSVYYKRGDTVKDLRQASSITDDSGFAFFNLNKEKQFYTIVREPEEGFAEHLKITEDKRKFFAVLGKDGALEILFFLLTLKSSEYVTAETIAKNIGYPLDTVDSLLSEMGSCFDMSGNPVFFSIKLLEKTGEQAAFGVNFAIVCNYITLLLLADSLLHSVHGYSMQVTSRWKPYLDREKVLEMFKK